jgi:hypothetical protein
MADETTKLERAKKQLKVAKSKTQYEKKPIMLGSTKRGK